ncbi:MAG: hypothetical protein ACRYFU_14205 [Janthinobacterium lividum]
MLAEWTAECGTDDPVIVVPWSDPDSGAHFVNLRIEPFDLAEISEAENYPALRRALRALNGARSAFLTSKCDAWVLYPELGGEKLEALRMELDLTDDEVAFGFASYIDVLWRERSVFASPHIATERLDRLIRRSAKLPHGEVSFEAVLRPAIIELNGTSEGFGATLYVTAVAADPETAMRRWEAALEAVVHLLRQRDQALPPGSATID